MSESERFKLPADDDFVQRDAVEFLSSGYGAVELDHPPEVFTDVPEDKALVWIVDNGPDQGGQLAYYVSSEIRFLSMLQSSPSSQEEAKAQKSEAEAAAPGAIVFGGKYRPFTWMLMDRETADRLVPGAAKDRAASSEDIRAEAERAAHPDNLLPVARKYRATLSEDAAVLQSWAAVLSGERTGTRYDDLLRDADVRRVAASDLKAIGRDLAKWAEADWLAVLGPEYNYDGPLPPFPGRS